MSRKPSSRIQFEFQSPFRTTSRLRVSQQKILCLQTISLCSRRKRWRSLESRPERCWLTWSVSRSVPCHFVGVRNSDLRGSGLHLTFLTFLCCLSVSQSRASPMVAAKQQFPACSLGVACVF